MDIIAKLLDLQKQATLERSHYYVASCVTEAIQEIMSLRQQLDSQQDIEADAEKLCKICGQGPNIDHSGCIIIGMHR